MRKFILWVLPLILILAGCETSKTIVSDVEEREANEIVVFLASRGIKAQKIENKTTGAVGAQNAATTYGIAVDDKDMTEAMAILNQNGLPRIKGTNLLELFAKQGLMTTDKEESIRYQAGLEQQIANTIRKIDGVIDATVQLSIPDSSTATVGPAATGTPAPKVTAAVYVKHQGIADDPNSHLVTKIKRLVAGSVNNLDINDVTVIADKSRFTDITLGTSLEAGTNQPRDYTSIWSIVLSKQSVPRFRFLFFILIAASGFFFITTLWIVWKFYPILRERGFKELLNPVPVQTIEIPPEPTVKE